MLKFLFIILFIINSLQLFCQNPIDSIMREIGRLDTTFVYKEELLVHIPNTNIKIQPPNHFLFSQELPGYIHSGTTTTIEFKEIHGTSYIMIDAGMTAENFSKQNATLLDKKEFITKNELTGILYLLEFEMNGKKYQRYMLLAGDYNDTMWVNASFLKSNKEHIEGIILKSLLTLEFAN